MLHTRPRRHFRRPADGRGDGPSGQPHRDAGLWPELPGGLVLTYDQATERPELSGPLFSSNVVWKQQILSVRTVYVLSSLQLRTRLILRTPSHLASGSFQHQIFPYNHTV